MSGWWCNANGSKYIANLEVLENITIFLCDALRLSAREGESPRTLAHDDAIQIVALLFAMLGDSPATCPRAIELAPAALAAPLAESEQAPACNYLTAMLMATIRRGVRTKTGPTARLSRNEESIVCRYAALLAATMSAGAGSYTLAEIAAHIKSSTTI